MLIFTPYFINFLTLVYIKVKEAYFIYIKKITDKKL